MIILGIDPGTATTGYGVIDTSIVGRPGLLGYGLVETSKELPHGQRLDIIFNQITQIILEHKPNAIAIERLFFATNALTAIAVGQAIGVIKLAIHRQGVPAYDYTPMQLKLYIAGSGRADKKLVKKTVSKIFHIRPKKGQKSHFDDTADAIALALCHARKMQL